MGDDFTLETKIQLAKRVGYHCSFPDCGSLTIGPSDESEKSTSSVGTACHISAASKGTSARRYNSALSSDERKHISNGVWMCDKHGKLIDTDETRFSTELLKTWKKLAENVASLMIQKGHDYKTALRLLEGKKLANNEVFIEQVGKENEVIGNLITDSCISIVWDKHISDAIRDYLIEHFRNCVNHGNATKFEIKILDNKIILLDNGSEFNPQSLIETRSKTGGTIAIQNLILKFTEKIIFVTNRESEINKTIITILEETKDILDVTSCSVQLTSEDFHSGNSSLIISKDCDEFYVVLPPYFALSDVSIMPKKFPQFDKSGKKLIFIVEHISDGVQILLQENYPECRIIRIQ
jgi:hypothetical protein